MPRWARPNDRSSIRPLIVFALAAMFIAIIAVLVWPSSGPLEDSGLKLPPTAEAEREPRPDDRPSRPAAIANHVVAKSPVVRPGTLHGTIRWDYGGAVAGAEVALLDETGEVVVEMKTDDTGTYQLSDESLVGAELQVTEPYGAAHQRDLLPLKAGEDRSFDVVIGDQREVVGWVLDGAGDPVPGVLVTAAWEAADSRWRAVTDRGGSFTFVDVPATPLRITADGGDLGIASARVARTDAARREVTLVLEPIGTILVRADAEVAKLGQVTVRCFSASAHGEDGLWNDDLRAPPEVVNEDGVEPGMEEPQPSDDPTMPEMENLIGNALRGWDSNDPEGSLVRMALDMALADPRIEAEMRRDMATQFPEMSNGSLEDMARAAANKVLEEEPRVLDMMGLAALKLQEGASAMEAFMLAEQELREPPVEPNDSALGPQPGEAEAMPVEAPVEAMPVEPAVELEEPYEAAELNGSEGEMPEDLSEYHGEYDLGEDYVEPNEDYTRRVEELREASHIDTIGMGDEPRSVVATGRFFEPIPVRGAFEYQVSIKTADGYELICGTVFVAPGEEVEITCGGSGPATMTGRVVDVRGAPLEGVRVEAYTDQLYETTSDKNGRYTLTPTVNGAQLVTLSASDTDGTVWAQRRQQNARPGQATEVPDLIVRRPDEQPARNLTEPFGGVGASIELGSEGIVLSSLFDDGPLAMAGVESGDVIVRIGEELGASLSVDDALSMLRGEVGTDVDLTLRSAAGELYELMLTRGLVKPVRELDYE